MKTTVMKYEKVMGFMLYPFIKLYSNNKLCVGGGWME